MPIKFRLFRQAGPVVFESILSDAGDANDFSFLKFTPTPALSLTFSGLYNLSTRYAYTMGNCGGGALRWSVRLDVGNDGDPANDGSLFIYYGAHPNFTECLVPANDPAVNQSGLNMIARSELRYDSSQFSGLGGTFYDSYAHVSSILGSLRVLRASLVVDSGWYPTNATGADKLDISEVTVNDNTFVPLSGSTRTCDLPVAAIKITKLPSTVVGSPVSVQPPKSDPFFRVVDCMYIYNLSTLSLAGPGTYKVEAIVGGNLAAGYAQFTIP